MERLFIFNPDCELAIANGGKFYTPPVNIVQLAGDLAFLPAYLGSQGDKVLVKALPDSFFEKSVRQSLGVPCQPVLEEDVRYREGIIAEPWGWSPKICYWLAARGIGKEWKPEQKEWYSRKTAYRGLYQLMEILPFIEKDILPEICYSVEEVEQKINGGCWIVKAPWSSSGKGLLFLGGKVGPKEREWLGGVIKRQGYLMLEKKLEKKLDFAMEFYVSEQEVQFVGWSWFTTGEGGKYQGNYVGAQENITVILNNLAGRFVSETLIKEIPVILSHLFPFYNGYLGVDMMLYEDKYGQIRVHPCVEINLRYNMGIIALALSRKYITGNARGEFTIEFYANPGEALHKHREKQQHLPAQYKNNRLQAGYLNLTPVNETTHFIASLTCY